MERDGGHGARAPLPTRGDHLDLWGKDLTLPPTIALFRARLCRVVPHYCVTWGLQESLQMDVNRRRLIGASAAGMAGALAMPSEPVRAAPLTPTLGRDATQYGERPGAA
jgi:hypothetical protein